MEQFTPLTKDRGLYKKILKTGSGPCPKDGDTVTVAYKGILDDGTQFDEGDSITFQLGDKMITGWEVGIKTMKIGEKSILVMRDDYAYGEEGFEQIPPKASLIFLIDLLDFASE